MSILVQIIGAPTACKVGVKDKWREAASWVARQLKVRFEDSVEVCYFNLFDTDCPALPAEAQLPLVLVNGEVLSSGGKISVPDIRRKIENITEEENA